ncbi:GMC oxidoreductase [Sphingomonas oryzagri]
MILDLDQLESPLARPRVLVLGAGAVGILLSVALARRGISVLLCEAGGRTVEAASQALNDATVVGRKHQGIAHGRARLLGGTTTLWGGQLISFRDIDFRARPWLDLPAWPIAREAVAPYYEQAATMLGLQVRGDDDATVWKALGLSRPDFGTDLEFVLTRWLKETNLARVFRGDLESNPNLTVLLHATATGFVPTTDRAGIAAVELCAPGGRTLTVGAQHVVVATGTIEASRLMLATAHARPELPWAGNAHVGVGFQDHIDLRVGDVQPIDKTRFDGAFDNIFIKGFKYNPKIVLAPHVQETQGLTNIAGSFLFESSLTEHLSNLKIFLRAMRNGARPPNLKTMPGHFMALVKVWWPLVMRYIKDNRVYNPADLGIKFKVHCEQKPLARSQIRLDTGQRDANGMPRVILDWQVDGSEMKAMAVFSRIVATELERQGIARLTIDPRVLAEDPTVLDEAIDSNHNCGGLRMAANAKDGVVDAELRVHGTSNLHVAGASVFPSSSFANPTFTAMALALRLADHIGGPT